MHCIRISDFLGSPDRCRFRTVGRVGGFGSDYWYWWFRRDEWCNISDFGSREAIL